MSRWNILMFNIVYIASLSLDRRKGRRFWTSSFSIGAVCFLLKKIVQDGYSTGDKGCETVDCFSVDWNEKKKREHNRLHIYSNFSSHDNSNSLLNANCIDFNRPSSFFPLCWIWLLSFGYTSCSGCIIYFIS